MKLFEPIIIRGMKLKNRILMEPMEVGLGYRSRKARAFYVERAKGGVGTIVAPGLSVDLLLYDDTWGTPGAVSSFIEGLKKLTEDIHREDCKIGLQLFHAPRFPSGTGNPQDLRGDLVAPSRRVEPNPPVHPYVSAFDELRELTVAEIEQVIERFGKAAGNAKAAGFDFVEFHGSHGYFASQFFSPLDNWRDDKFGGTVTRRMSFGIECVKAIRKVVGDDYPLFFRLGATEYRPDGIALQESVKFAQELEWAGVDAIDVTVCGPSYFFVPVPEFKPGTFVHQAEAIKEKVKIPVIAVGRIHEPELAEAILSQGKADLVGIGRQLLADPYWPEKVASGKEDDIVPCLSCNVCADKGETVCSVNPWLGRELEYRMQNDKTGKVNKAQKVLVIGGGPAGMEVARVAAMRGHEVTLLEKEGVLGGQLRLATVPPHKEDIERLIKYLRGQVKKMNVRVELKAEGTIKDIEKRKPDVAVIATGGSSIIPKIPGIESNNVVKALDVLTGKVPVGKRILIVGGGAIGCETADYLAEQGKHVTILEMLEEIGSDLGKSIRDALLQRLKRKGVRMNLNTKMVAIKRRGVLGMREGHSMEFFEGDTIVLALGVKPDSELPEEFKGKIKSLYVIGDCRDTGRIAGAMRDAVNLGWEI